MEDFRFLADDSADIICRFGLDMRLHYVSPASIDILGWTPEEIVAMPPFALLVPEDIPVVLSSVQRHLTKGVRATPVVARNVRKDGSVVWLEITARVVRDPVSDEPTETILTMRDISERKLLQDQLLTLALTDALTGMANRRAFDGALDREWRRISQEGSQISLLLLDIDCFKRFNDRYGHQCGDDCLRAIATAIQGAVRRETDTVARYGGEEFAVILPGADGATAMKIAESVRWAILALGIQHTDNEAGSKVVTASIGVATALARQGAIMRMPESLLLTADQALYKAKHNGRDTVATALLMSQHTP